MEIIEQELPLNDFVPIEVRFKHLLHENGILKSEIDELNYKLNLEKNSKVIKSNDPLDPEFKKISELYGHLHKKNVQIKELTLEIEKLKKVTPDEASIELLNIRRLLTFLSEKYNFNIIKEKNNLFQ